MGIRIGIADVLVIFFFNSAFHYKQFVASVGTDT